MKVILQRVLEASVSSQGLQYSSIQNGLLAYVCFELGDSQLTIDKFYDKVSRYKIFEGDSCKLDTSLSQLNAELLVISQFTLSATTNKGLKPSYHLALENSQAKTLFELMVETSKHLDIKVFFGEFGANMQVSSINDGPYTLIYNF